MSVVFKRKQPEPVAVAFGGLKNGQFFTTVTNGGVYQKVYNVRTLSKVLDVVTGEYRLANEDLLVYKLDVEFTYEVGK